MRTRTYYNHKCQILDHTSQQTLKQQQQQKMKIIRNSQTTKRSETKLNATKGEREKQKTKPNPKRRKQINTYNEIRVAHCNFHVHRPSACRMYRRKV